MDVDTSMAKTRYKSAEWLNQDDEGSLESKSKTNRSTIFTHSYFWSLYLLGVSFIVDLLFYLFYYQEKFQIGYFYQPTLILRVVNDILFLFPILIFIKYAFSNKIFNYIIGLAVFLPQLVLSIISLVRIYTQEFCPETNYDPNLCYYDPNEEHDSIIRRLNYVRITILRTCSLVNLILYIIGVALTFLKLIKNY